MSKAHEMESFLNKLARIAFARERKLDQCVSCGTSAVMPEDFRDDLSRREFGISHFCQECQDSVFGV